jgi:uncharacterized membrane protein
MTPLAPSAICTSSSTSETWARVTKTPLILFGEVWFVTAVPVLVLVAVSLLAYRLAS